MNWWKEAQTSAEEDKKYFDALRRGDMETAQKIVDAAAKRSYKEQAEARKRDLDSIGKMKFPFKAEFGGEEVSVLGSIHSFHPYKSEKLDFGQLMCAREDGRRFVTLPTMLKVDGRLLVQPVRHAPEQVFSAEHPFGRDLPHETVVLGDDEEPVPPSRRFP